MENGVFAPTKNEPKTNPISNFPLGFNQFMKNMQNEPNFQNAHMNLNPVKTKDYMKYDAFSSRKNEPNSNPIYGKTNPIKCCPVELNSKLKAVFANGRY